MKLPSAMSRINPYAETATGAGSTYEQIRPGYPPAALQAIWSRLGRGSGLNIVDIGAGTGKLTGALNPDSNRVVAVEPSAEMSHALSRLSPSVEIVQASAEDCGLPAQSADLLTYGQCWHWLDEDAAVAEAHRILKPGGHLAVLYNQLEVSVPWVHRLSRIMRSGDVHRPDRPPRLGEGFTSPSLEIFRWCQQLYLDQIKQLAKTRASYLRASAQVKTRMQDNLHWYLYEHLGFDEGQQVELPYQTLLWMAAVRR